MNVRKNPPIKRDLNKMPKSKSTGAAEKLRFFTKSGDGLTAYYYDQNFIYAEKGEENYKLALFDKHYYKLRLVNGVPILEIDGLRMQLIRDFESPLDYAKEVLMMLKVPKSGSFSLLDTCMGLGYTAIEASKQDAIKQVTTCEVSNAVLKLALWNPFSENLFKKEGKIKILMGNAYEIMKTLNSSSFDFVIHDPPRISHAPELYSILFYLQLYRCSKTNAKLFHYVGSVGKKSGRNIYDEVSKRLLESGFKNIKYVERLQGLIFNK